MPMPALGGWTRQRKKEGRAVFWGAVAVSTKQDAMGAIAAGAAAAENRITRSTTAKLTNVHVSSDGAIGAIGGDVTVSATAAGTIDAFTLGIAGSVSSGATLAVGAA